MNKAVIGVLALGVAVVGGVLLSNSLKAKSNNGGDDNPDDNPNSNYEVFEYDGNTYLSEVWEDETRALLLICDHAQPGSSQYMQLLFIPVADVNTALYPAGDWSPAPLDSLD